MAFDFVPLRPVRLKSLARLGYVPAGEIDHDGHRFLKFRHAPQIASPARPA